METLLSLVLVEPFTLLLVVVVVETVVQTAQPLLLVVLMAFKVCEPLLRMFLDVAVIPLLVVDLLLCL